MKIKTKYLPIFSIILGLTGFALRLWLFRTGVDHKGLLLAEHPANSLTFLLTGIFLLGNFLWTRNLRKIRSHKKLYPASWVALIGCICAAAGIALTTLYELQVKQDLITTITMVLAALSAISLVLLGVGRLKGLRPNFLMQAMLTVYLMFHLVSQYRLWSSEPQLQVYCFQLLASVFLMLSVFHGTVLDTQVGSRRMFVFFNQGALFFCCMSFVGDWWFFYTAMGIFCATNVCSLKDKPYVPKYLKEET